MGEPSAPVLTVSLSALASAGSSLSSVVRRAAQVRLLSHRRSRALLLPRERWRCGWTKRRFDGMICSSSAPSLEPCWYRPSFVSKHVCSSRAPSLTAARPLFPPVRRAGLINGLLGGAGLGGAGGIITHYAQNGGSLDELKKKGQEALKEGKGLTSQARQIGNEVGSEAREKGRELTAEAQQKAQLLSAEAREKGDKLAERVK